MKICEYLCFGARTIEHTTEQVASIKSTHYIEPEEVKDPSYILIGYDYPTVKKQGSLVVNLENGYTEVYPASNWQIEF